MARNTRCELTKLHYIDFCIGTHLVRKNYLCIHIQRSSGWRFARSFRMVVVVVCFFFSLSEFCFSFSFSYYERNIIVIAEYWCCCCCCCCHRCYVYYWQRKKSDREEKTIMQPNNTDKIQLFLFLFLLFIRSSLRSVIWTEKKRTYHIFCRFIHAFMKPLVSISLRILMEQFQVIALFKSAICDFPPPPVFCATKKNAKRYSFEYFIYGRKKKMILCCRFWIDVLKKKKARILTK